MRRRTHRIDAGASTHVLPRGRQTNGRTPTWNTLLFATGALAAATLVGGCGREKPDESGTADLDSILRDGELTFMRAALTATPDGAGGSTGGPIDGGAPSRDGGGSGGTTSVGGRSGGFDGGIGGSVGGPGGRGVGGLAGGTGGIGLGGFSGTGGAKPGTGGGGPSGGRGGAPAVPFPQLAQGKWTFDDCNSFETGLFDESFHDHPAFRSVNTACATGRQGFGLAIDEPEDYVYVPDQPSFTFASGVTVAAWVKPDRLGGVRTIFRKREGGSSTFVLAQNGNDYQFVIRLNDGRTAAVSARARINVWTHVAATYDGADISLYLDGVRAARKHLVGQLSEGVGPLLMGNDANGRRMQGTLDDVVFATIPATATDVAGLSCSRGTATVVATPAAGPRVAAGTRVAYDLALTNNDSTTCGAKSYQFFVNTTQSGLFVDPQFSQTDALAPGATGHLTLGVSSDLAIDPDTYQVPFQFSAVSEDFRSFDVANGTVAYSVDGGPCSIRLGQELMIRDPSVVDDAVRTAPGGVWTFGRLMENLAPTAAAAPDMVEQMLQTWLTDQSANGFTIPARPAMQNLVLSSFPRGVDGKLDLSRAPMRLLAIVNRIDLRDLANHDAGEGRFVFGVLDPSGFPTQFTMIFEYKLPAETEADVLGWANRWHALAALPFPSAEYNAALEQLTEGFAGRNARPGAPNGSALSQFRTNEIALSFIWELREFHLSATTGLLVPSPVALTPDFSFNFSPQLGTFINDHEAEILVERHTIPLSLGEGPFQAAAVTNDLNGWDPAGVINSEARHKFSVNTCNGCHSSRETGTPFLHINPRFPGQAAFLSGFLTGTSVFDFRDGTVRNFNDLRRRNRDLRALVCPNEPLPPDPTGTGGTGMGGIGGGGSGGRSGAGGRGVPPIPGMGGASGVGGAGGMRSGGMSSGTGGAIGTGGAGASGTSGPGAGLSTPTAGRSVRIIDESGDDTTRPDFIRKGIGRVH